MDEDEGGDWEETGVWFAMLGNRDIYLSERSWELAQKTDALCRMLEDGRTPFLDMIRRKREPADPAPVDPGDR